MSTEVELWVVDRFEGSTAVLVSDDGEVVEVAETVLPAGARVGVVVGVRRAPDGALAWNGASVEKEATRERRREAEAVLEELKRRDPGGDITL